MDMLPTVDSKRLLRSMRRFTLLAAGLGFALCSLVLAPIFLRYATDVMYRDSWWVYILYLLTDGSLIDLAVVTLCYPASLYAIWRLGFRKGWSVPATFALLTLGKYIVNFIFPALTYEGALPEIGGFLSFDLPIMLANFGLEMLQFALVILAAVIARRAYFRKSWMIQARDFDGDELTLTDPDTGALFHFDRVISWKNPAQLSALLMGGVITVLRIAMHQIYQYTLYFHGGTDGLLVMLVDLFADLFIGIIVYFAALLLLSRFRRKELEKAAS